MNLIQHFNKIRAQTENFCSALEVEDFSVQPMVDVSPPKWHLAHTSWFFEQFVLCQFSANYQIFHEDFSFLFNSYYNNVGKRVLRPNRGLMTRPTVKEVFAYRQHVTKAMQSFLQNNITQEQAEIIEIGINHEEQHLELLAYDIKYILGHQALFPSLNCSLHLDEINSETAFLKISGGLYKIGHQKDSFCFDNEHSVHQVYLNDFSISSNLISNKEYIEFIEAGAYKNFNLWHAEGWDFILQNEIEAPLYWHKMDGEWHYYHFNGLEKVKLNLPVMNISFYEAYAFAEWKKMRLPTEFEWEVAADQLNWGQLWEWTNSAYLPYPSFSKKPGALGEYNGKFMVNQHVLRGASIATPKNHSRKTYRNFFHPHLRWMFSGIRLVKK